jgi:hypothetical protein
MPTSASEGTAAAADCARAAASASATVAPSGNSTGHSHCRSGVANTTVQRFMI